jgi:hypothetical protein
MWKTSLAAFLKGGISLVTEKDQDYDAHTENTKWSIRTANVYKKEGLEGCDDSWLVDGYILHAVLGVLSYKWYWNGYNTQDNLHARHLHITEVEKGMKVFVPDAHGRMQTLPYGNSSMFAKLVNKEDPITPLDAAFGWGGSFVPIFDCLSMDIQSRFDYIHSVYEGNMHKVYQEDNFFTHVRRNDLYV